MYQQTENAINFLTGAYFPSLPESVFKIKHEIESGQPNFKQIANYISSEGELSLKFIDLTRELIGSSLGQTPSILNIVTHLGFDSVYEILIAAFLERKLIRTPFDQQVIEMCRRSALVCYYLSKDVKLINQSEAYLSGLLQGISFIFLNRINIQFEKQYSYFISNPIKYYEALNEKCGFTIGHADMVLANHWKMKRTQLKAFGLVFLPGLVPTRFKRTHHKKAYQLSRLIMLGHIYAVESCGESYLSDALRKTRIEIEFELSIPKDSAKLVRTILIHHNKIQQEKQADNDNGAKE